MGAVTRYLLDTDIAVFAMRRNATIIARLANKRTADVITSALVYSQLLQGIDLQPFPDIERALVANLVMTIVVFPYDQTAAEIYGEIVRTKGYNRRHAFDRMIAAHAISLDATLVTNNTADFADIDGLRLENWAG